MLAQRSQSSISPAVAPRAEISNDLVLSARSKDLLNTLAGVPIAARGAGVGMNVLEAPIYEPGVVIEPLPRLTFQDVASARLFFQRTGEQLPILEPLAV